MSNRARWTVMLLCGAWLLHGPHSEAASTERSCVIVRAVARYGGVGYHHLASTENGCTRPVRCELWTDVDPEPRHVVDLAPRGSAETVFRLDSPAYTFRVSYRCQYR